MLPQGFVDSCNEAIWWIGVRLANAAIDFGPTEFPGDSGISFRNSLFKYAYSYFRTLFHLLQPDTKDEWSTRNRDPVLNLGREQLNRMTGLSHFHVHGSRLFMQLEEVRKNSFLNPEGSAAAVKGMQQTLGWLSGAYAFPDSIPVNWNRILTTQPDFSSYQKQSQLYFYSELAYALLLHPADSTNSACWSGMAFIA